MPPLSDYYTQAKDGGLAFTQAFYDLGLRGKYRIVLRMQIEGLLENPRTLHRLGSAILQHSTRKSKADSPCSGVRTLSKKARENDNNEFPEILRMILLENPDGLTSMDYLVKIFEITETDLEQLATEDICED